MKKSIRLLKGSVNPVRNSSRALNPAGIILKWDPTAEQRGIISNGVNQHGSIVIFVAVALIMLLGFAALAVDIGHITVTKNELQNISDASSLAATRQLGAIYETMFYEDQQTYNCNDEDQAKIRAAALDVGSKNIAGKKNITIDPNDVIIAKWNPNTKAPLTTNDYNQPDAVRVIARRSSSSSSAEGPISNFFAKVLGKDTTNVETDGTAALTGQSTTGEGGLPLPVGISEFRFKTTYCDQPIRFYPANDPVSCGGWHTYTGDTYQPNAGNNGLPKLLNDLKDGTYVSPETKGGTEFAYTGGTLTSVFDEMKALFDTMKVKNDGKLDNDKDSTTWTTNVVVYGSEDCSNPNQTLKVVGFAEVTITEVLDAPEKIINAVIKCDYVEAGRGGGGNYGTKGSIPGLVE